MKHIYVFIRSILTAGFVLSVIWSFGQSQEQAKLLKEAYKKQSTIKLYEFFDRWAEEVKSNEDDADNKYVAEAHKVFTAFYQPLDHEKIGGQKSPYYDSPYFILQSSLWLISETEFILYKSAEIDSFCLTDTGHRYGNCYLNKEVQYLSGSETIIAKDVEFRPSVYFEGKKVVYFTEEYEQLLNLFIGYACDDCKHRTKQPNKIFDKVKFLSKAAVIYSGHFRPWDYYTKPSVESIMFNKELNRAVVSFQLIYCGGIAIMEKQDGVWTIVDAQIAYLD